MPIMPTKLNRVPVLLADEENGFVETEMKRMGEARSNVIRRPKVPPIKTRQKMLKRRTLKMTWDETDSI